MESRTPKKKKRDRTIEFVQSLFKNKGKKEDDAAGQASTAVSKASSLAEANETNKEDIRKDGSKKGEMEEEPMKEETIAEESKTEESTGKPLKNEEATGEGSKKEESTGAPPRKETTEEESKKEEPTGELPQKEETERVGSEKDEPVGEPTNKEETTGEESKKEGPSKKNLTSEDLWAQANKTACERNPDLMADYIQILSNSDNASALTTSQLARAKVDQLNKFRQDEQWRLSILGKDIKIREQTEKLVKFLLWVDKIVKVAVDGQPYATLAWTTVSVVLQLVESGEATHADIMVGFETISHIQMYWRICEDEYLQYMQHLPNADEFIKALTDLYASITEYQARAICHMSKRQFARAWKNVTGSTEWAGIAQAVNTLSDRCKDYMEVTQQSAVEDAWNKQLDYIKETRDILDDIRILLKYQGELAEEQCNDEKEGRLFEDMFSFYENSKNANPDIIPKTCEWFLHDEQFRRWRNSDDCGLLWVSAGPGCGKSVLSRHLINNKLLSNRITTSIVCYFFFKDGIEDRSNAANALAAILHQLFSQDSSRKLIKLAYQKHHEQGKNLVKNFEALWGIFESCVQELDPAAELVCILDALDECNEKSLDDLLKKLNFFYTGWHEIKKRVKFLMTSRPFDFIKRPLKAFSNQSFYGHTDADNHSDAISEEINIVIDSRLGEILEMEDASKYKDLAAHMKSTENRTYLWVHLALEFIRQDSIMFRLDPNNKELLATLPLDLDEQYERLLNRGQSRGLGKHMLEFLLQFMLVAVRPLSLHEANSALTIALGKEDDFPSYDAMDKKRPNLEHFRSGINDLCGHFVSIHDSKLYFIHQTAREFLTSVDENEKFKWKGHFNMHEAHEKFSLVCMRFMQLLEPSFIQEGRNFYESSWFEDEFFYYTTKHWMNHVASQNEVADDVLRHAQILCRVDEGFEKAFLQLDRYRHFGGIWRVYHKNFNTPEQAKRINLDVCLAVYLGLPALAKYIIKYDQVDMSQGDYLLCATMAEDLNMIERLLDFTDQIQVTEREMLAAVDTNDVISILLLFQEKRPDQARMTESMLLKIISTKTFFGYSYFGITVADFVKALFYEKWDLEKEEQKIFAFWASDRIKFNQGVRKLFQVQNGRIQITDAIVKAAASNSLLSPVLLSILGRYGEEIRIPEENVLIMLSMLYTKFPTHSIFLPFWEEYGNKVRARQGVVEAAAVSMRDDVPDTILDFLLKNERMVYRAVLNAASHGDCNDEMVDDVRWLLKILVEPPIESKVLEAVATNCKSGYSKLYSMLRTGRCRVELSLIWAAMRNTSGIQKAYILPLLFEYSSHGDTIAKAIIYAMESLEEGYCIEAFQAIARVPRGREAVRRFAKRDWGDLLDE